MTKIQIPGNNNGQNDPGITATDHESIFNPEDFFYIPVENKFYCAATGTFHFPDAIKRMFGKVITEALGAVESGQLITSMTWAPGKPRFIYDQFIFGADTGAPQWQHEPGSLTLNKYSPAPHEPGDLTKADPWVNHINKLYPEEANHIISWCAHRVQKPGEKCNHALVLGGPQGSGKDTLIAPVRRAVGNHNVKTPPAPALLSNFNEFDEAVLLIVPETRDMPQKERWMLYESMKERTASPPEWLRINKKHQQPYYVQNVAGVVYFTNSRYGALALPPDDRRHFVAWTNSTPGDFGATYFEGLYKFFESGGYGHIRAYLQSFDYRAAGFDPYRPPRKTDAWHDLVNHSASIEEEEIRDALVAAGNPDVLTLEDIRDFLDYDGTLKNTLTQPENRKKIPYWMQAVGYGKVPNPDSKQGLWRDGPNRIHIYGRNDMSRPAQVQAAKRRLSVGSLTEFISANPGSHLNN